MDKSQSHIDIMNHIHRLQVELERVQLVVKKFPPGESCRDELEEIHQSVSSILHALKSDLLNLFQFSWARA
jgi:hypothetical protein